MTERLIDANALIRCLDEKVGEGWHSCSLAINMGYIDGIADAIQAVDDQPTIDAEPVRHGSWINRRFDMATCSCCGDRWGSTSLMKYCPHCGAKMDAEEDEE